MPTASSFLLLPSCLASSHLISGDFVHLLVPGNAPSVQLHGSNQQQQQQQHVLQVGQLTCLFERRLPGAKANSSLPPSGIMPPPSAVATAGGTGASVSCCMRVRRSVIHVLAVC